MHEIGRELDDVGERGVLGHKRRLDIRKDLGALDIEIAQPHAFSFFVCRHLTRDEQKLRCFDACNLRILAKRLSQGWRIMDGNLRHVAPCGDARDDGSAMLSRSAPTRWSRAVAVKPPGAFLLLMHKRQPLTCLWPIDIDGNLDAVAHWNENVLICDHAVTARRP